MPSGRPTASRRNGREPRREEIAAFDTRLVRVEIKLNLLITRSVSTLVGIGMLVIRLFLMD